MGNVNQGNGQGEFRGDCTRDTFDVAKHFSRVVIQQGRVQLDADWNEQTSILLHYLRSLAADLIGQHGGPGDGFKIIPAKDGDRPTFKLSGGRYYVDGIACEAGEILFADAASLQPDQSYAVFLDVWERHITADEDSDIADVALGGPDTAARAQVMLQPRAFILTSDDRARANKLAAAYKSASPAAKPAAKSAIDRFVTPLIPLSNARLRARAKVPQVTEACHISPESRYRGAENQLYRVEVHRGGNAWDGQPDTKKTAATFKWSRDNSSVVCPVLTLTDDAVTLASPGREGSRGLREGDWVEIVDDDLAPQGQVTDLLQIKAISPDAMTVTLSAPWMKTYDENDTLHPRLRRWDQPGPSDASTGGAFPLQEGKDDEDASNWIALEDGVEIQFAQAPPGSANAYRAGDYWLIPARVATGDVLWPWEKTAAGVETYISGNPKPAARLSHGVEHHYAPLGIIEVSAGQVTLTADLSRAFSPLAT